MATITRYLSKRVTSDKKAEIFIRVSVNRQIRGRFRTSLFVDVDRMDDNGKFKLPKANQKLAQEIKAVELALIAIEQRISGYINQDPDNIIIEGIEACINPDKPKVKKDKGAEMETGIDGLFEQFIKARGISPGTVKKYKVLERLLYRFVAFKRHKGDNSFTLDLNRLTDGLKEQIKAFVMDESEAYALYPEIYDIYPFDTRKARKTHKVEPRGRNTVISLLRGLSCFLNWCNDKGYANCDSNFGYGKINGQSGEIYGDPIFLTTEERDTIARFDMTGNPTLAKQRDIFIFQCYVGCRVSDLLSLTNENIVETNGEKYLIYIAKKTLNKKADTVRVPLHPIALNLIEKYKGEDGRLFPFTSSQHYNKDIKKILELCGVTRYVTVLNPKTMQQEQRRICDLASSHMARRTFVGNLYNKTPDPNLIGSMTGHVEGSKAFTRYRKINDETKSNLINLL